MQENIKIIKNHISGERAFSNVAELVNFHRVQASPGYRDAANYCINYLDKQGINARLEKFEAREDAKYWQRNMFKEWACDDAYLTLIEPKEIKLADFRSNSMSIIQRSFPVDFRNQTVDVVMLDKGNDEENYRDIDLNGKVIFIKESYEAYYDWAINKKGAIGIITDNMPEISIVRQRNDLYDATTNISFNWANTDEEKGAFGFVLTPRLGDELRKICISLEAQFKADNSKNRYPKVNIYVDSKIYDGKMENVIGTIVGETDEEVMVSAHLCHPKSCANDNASGVSVAMEAIKTINDLINNGELKKPKRTIKMLLIPEFTGTFAYLQKNERHLDKIKAAINLDMVGGKQEKVFGPLVIMAPPDSCPSFAYDTALLVADDVKKEMKMLAVKDYVSTFILTEVAFSPGSDNAVFSDPMVGIPCVTLTQWPDKTYHTSQDTLDKIDPNMLRRSATICADYLYTMANLSVSDVDEVINKSKETYISALTKEVGKYLEKLIDENQLWDKVEYQRDKYVSNLQTYSKFFTGEELVEIKKRIENEEKYLNVTLENYMSFMGTTKIRRKESIDVKYSRKPIKLFKGGLVGTKYEKYLSKDNKEKYDALKRQYPKAGSMDTYIVYWCDGKKTISEINRCIALERDMDNIEYVHAFIVFLEQAELVKFN